MTLVEKVETYNVESCLTRCDEFVMQADVNVTSL